jgi:hypothetical protein
LLICSSFRRQRRQAGLKDKTSFKHLSRHKAMQRSENRKRAGVERRRSRCNKGASTMAALEHSHGRKKANARAECRAAYLQLTGEISLRRKAVTRTNHPRTDERTDMLDDLHGELAMARDLVELFFNLFFHAE